MICFFRCNKYPIIAMYFRRKDYREESVIVKRSAVASDYGRSFYDRGELFKSVRQYIFRGAALRHNFYTSGELFLSGKITVGLTSADIIWIDILILENFAQCKR